MVISSRAHIEVRSPYDLIQERYPSDPWKIMVVCMMLNMTRGSQVKGVIDEFFRRYPNPGACAVAVRDELQALISPLGLAAKRASTLIRFSSEWIDQPWNDVSELHGIGKYARDAWAVFVEGNLPEPETITDGKLRPYVEWARSLVT